MSKRDNYHLRDLPSVSYHEHQVPSKFVRFVDDYILPRLALTGYKLNQKKAVATQIIYNLIMTGLAGKVVADTRSKDRKGVRQRIGIWDQIVDAGFAKICLGSEESGKRTRYRATGKLLKLQEQWDLCLLLNLELVRNTERPHDPKPLALVYLHTGKNDLNTGKPLPEDKQKQPIPFLTSIKNRAQLGPDGNPDPRAIHNGLDYWQAMEDRIERINRSNLEHSWQAFAIDLETDRKYVFQPNVCVRQIHVGEFFRAVRLYSWSELSAQNLSQSTRRTMLIDGESVAELDYSGMATRMLYHQKNIDPPGDVYFPDKVFPTFYSLDDVTDAEQAIVRNFIKRATNICWNVINRRTAHSAIGKLLTEHEQNIFLHKVINQIENLDLTEFVDRLLAVHVDLKDMFFTGCGIDLMTIDGWIMLHILESFSDVGKPALGIHDSIVCKASDVAFAKETMAEMYQKFLPYKPVIKRVF